MSIEKPCILTSSYYFAWAIKPTFKVKGVPEDEKVLKALPHSFEMIDNRPTVYFVVESSFKSGGHSVLIEQPIKLRRA